MTFTDEEGYPRQFTWRTIQTWYSRYQKHGVTVMENQPRSDKGKRRKVVIEDMLKAVQKVLFKLGIKMQTLRGIDVTTSSQKCLPEKSAH